MGAQTVITRLDFERILNDYAGRELLRIPITKTIDNISGEETLTEGTPIFIKAYFMRTMQNWNYQKEGFLEAGDAVMLAKSEDEVAKDDLICADIVQVNLSNIDGDATTITVDTAIAHGLSAGDEVIIANTTNYDGIYTVATITDADTFTIADTNHNENAETSGYIGKDYQKFRIKERYDVPGVFDNDGTAGGTIMTYTAANLFLAK